MTLTNNVLLMKCNNEKIYREGNVRTVKGETVSLYAVAGAGPTPISKPALDDLLFLPLDPVDPLDPL